MSGAPAVGLASSRSELYREATDSFQTAIEAAINEQRGKRELDEEWLTKCVQVRLAARPPHRAPCGPLQIRLVTHASARNDAQDALRKVRKTYTSAAPAGAAAQPETPLGSATPPATLTSGVTPPAVVSVDAFSSRICLLHLPCTDQEIRD